MRILDKGGKIKMSTDTQKKSTLATKVKGLLGVEDDVKLKPMIAYNSAIFCLSLQRLRVFQLHSMVQLHFSLAFVMLSQTLLWASSLTEQDTKTADTDHISSGAFYLLLLHISLCGTPLVSQPQLRKQATQLP